MEHIIGIDVGGTEIKAAVFGPDAQIIYHQKVSTPAGEAHIRIPEAVIGIMDNLMSQYGDICGVGISTAGVVDTRSGEIIFAGGTIPSYKGTNLKQLIQERYGISVTIANDVNAAARGEWWKGAARGSDHFFCMTLGTGIGGCMFSSGQIVEGAHFRAGEIGHSLYDKSTGTTYEQRASMSVLMKRARQEIVGFTGDGIELFERARQGDKACGQLIGSWTEEIARGIAEMILYADPSIIVIGGGVSEQKQFLLDQINAHLAAYLPPGFSQTQLVTAELGNKAALYGAVYPYFE
ncbi:ROK family protein [Paenibacillus dokdonensis]|uniref:ROK family protein n=1 Tax=Paenibacillus dokdonensis TaxID=2567944 RepID=A0ABU6GHM2_9BACL|nr:ROK family protein [Paenibacillus dokdonensis]MEC0238874.1 ROK family protein [Paenibacillus dokdonensis]